MDEALALPSEQAVQIALRTQQVIGYESGVTDTVDPLGGSYFVERLTNELEAKARLYERFHNDTALWVQLGGAGGNPGDAVYPIPLEALP